MASTNKTTNYELSQFIETDRPAWLTDYNGDMRTIDSTMKAISDVASGASGSISELADRMSTAEGNISTNTNDIATLDARADSLEAQAQSTAGTIANIQTEQTAQNLGIEAATELGYNLARPYDSASTYAVGDYVLFQNTLYKCITAVTVGEAFNPIKWLAIKAMDEIAGGGSSSFIETIDTGYLAGKMDFQNPIRTDGTFNISVRTNNHFTLGNMLLLPVEITLTMNFTTAPSGGSFTIKSNVSGSLIDALSTGIHYPLALFGFLKNTNTGEVMGAVTTASLYKNENPYLYLTYSGKPLTTNTPYAMQMCVTYAIPTA